MVAVREHLVLKRKERAPGVDEVDAREAILLGHLLRAEVLLHREGEVRAALHGGVVRDDDAGAALDDPDAGDDARGRRLVVVDPEGGERVQLEERRAGVDEPVDPLSRRELAARAMALHRCGAASRGDERGAVAELRDELLHPLRPPVECLVAGDVGREDGHAVSSVTRTVPDATCSPARTSTERTSPSNGRGHHLLHLHRLEHDERLVRRDRVPGVDPHLEHPSGHRRGDAAVASSGRAGSAAAASRWSGASVSARGRLSRQPSVQGPGGGAAGGGERGA